VESISRAPVQSRSVLLIVDVQVGLVELMPAELQEHVLCRIRTLLARARASGTPVIHIQRDGSEGHPLQTYTKGWEIHPSLKPAEGEPVLRKPDFDSFFKTALQRELEKRGITHLVVTGGMTEYCVDTTWPRNESWLRRYAGKRCPPHERQWSTARREDYRPP
jgi:nicotinamidase-related amidase